MRISELARLTDVTIPTVKFYLRQGLLPQGISTSMTQAEYDQRHVERLRLIRALVDVGGFPLAVVRTLLEALDGVDGIKPVEPAEPVAAEPVRPVKAAKATKAAKAKEAKTAAAGSGKPAEPSWAESAVGTAALVAINAAHGALPPHVPDRGQTLNRALAAVAALGWQVDPESFALRQLDAALVALDTVGVPPSVSTLLAYGAAADLVAQSDIAGIPADDPAEAIRRLVLGTVMYEPVLIALRRLAEQNALLSRQ